MVKGALFNQTGRFTIRPTKKICTVMGAASAGILAACGGLYFWQTGEMEARQKVVQAKHDEVEHADREVRRLSQVRDEFRETVSKLRFLETSVTPAAYIPTALRQIEALAKSTDLKIQRFSPQLEPAPGPPADKEARKNWKPQPYDKEHMELEVEGTYWDVARFLNRLTEFPKIIAVRSIQVIPKDTMTGRNPILGVKLRMDGFVFLADGAKGDAAGAGSGTVKPGSASQLRAEENKVIQQTAPQPAHGPAAH